MAHNSSTQINPNAQFFIAVYSFGGIINAIEINTSLVELWRNMKKKLASNFDGEEDDARIFNQKEEEVYFYNEDEECQEWFCPNCFVIYNRAANQKTTCDCNTQMKRLDI